MIDFLSFLEPAALSTLAGAAAPYVKEVLNNSGEMFKDLVKDVASDRIKDVLSDKKEWKKAVASAVTALIVEFKNGLDRAGLTEAECNGFSNDLKLFIKDQAVHLLIGQVMTESSNFIWQGLARRWNSLDLKILPENFDWILMVEVFQGQINTILESEPGLRDIVQTRSLQRISKSSKAGFNLSAYADGLRKRYGNLKLDSLYPDPEHSPMSLTRIFVEQNVRSCQEFNPRIHELPTERKKELLKKAALKDVLDEESLDRERQRFFQQKPTPVLEIVNDPQQKLIVILGDPGSGKSVLLDHLALQWAESNLLQRIMLPLPLLIELKSYVLNMNEGRCRDFLEYMDDGLGAVGHLDKDILNSMLLQGEAWLLIDGFDEIFDTALRQQIAQEVVRFTTKYPQAHFVVTSRIIGYDLIASIFRNSGFQHFMLQELNINQQITFLKKWHDLAYTDPIERQEKHERLLASIGDINSVSELAENPLLLTLMAILNRYRELPQDRNTLYEEASRILLHKWNADKALKQDPVLARDSIDHKNKEAMLRAVALAMQSGPKGIAGNAISGDELEDILFEYLKNEEYENTRSLAKRMVQQLRERNYILCLLGDDYYAFVHRTFLEYFCASSWIWKYEKGEKGTRLTLEQLREQTFEKYWKDETWHEVLQLIAARMEPRDAEELLMPLLDREDSNFRFRNIFFVSSCLSVLRNRKPLKLLSEKLRKLLLSLLYFDLPYVLSSQHNEANQIDRVRKTAVQALARGWKDDSKTLIWLKDLAQRDKYGVIREAAIKELARGWKKDSETTNILKKRAQQDESWTVRLICILELVQGWKEDSETVTILKNQVMEDENWTVRMTGLALLAGSFKDDQNTLLIVKNRAQNDTQEWVRILALQELVRVWKGELETLIILKNLLKHDDNKYVLKAVVKELVGGWKDDVDTLMILKKRVQQDKNRAIREVVVEELSLRWTHDPEVLTILKNLAQLDESMLVRQAAVKEIARRWKDDPETLTLLKEWVQYNDNWAVRETVVEELARGWKNDPNTLIILKDRAQHDESENVREVAIHELANGWKDDLTVMVFIERCTKMINKGG
ncbi:NACHT domain-containing protein [Candidatus Falkowbacteria bacterium]|nr:NACHT domain-containing protein [Candidatus Falkowbacteria bacterium]